MTTARCSEVTNSPRFTAPRTNQLPCHIAKRGTVVCNIADFAAGRPSWGPGGRPAQVQIGGCKAVDKCRIQATRGAFSAAIIYRSDARSRFKEGN
jgi:hypothetical protein